MKLNRGGGPLSLFSRFLNWVERIGNALPDPFTLFVLLGALVLVSSSLLSFLGVSVVHPNGSTVSVVNLLAPANAQALFVNAVKAFVEFPPLGVVLVTMIGMGVAERSGLLTTALRLIVTSAPRSTLSAAVIFAGVMSNIAADAGYVMLTPLGALVFASVGRHPLAGLSAAFAGVAGGFSANLLLTPLDPLLSGITTAAAQMLVPSASIAPSCNYYFMATATLFLTIVGAWITDRIVEPRLGRWDPSHASISMQELEVRPITERERKALIAAGITFVGTMVLLALLSVPERSFFRAARAETTLQSLEPLFKSLVLLMTLGFLLCGMAYGIVAGSIRSDRDIARMSAESLSTMGAYILLAFAAAQFVAWFKNSQLGTVIAISGANAMKSTGLTGIPAILAFILITAFINLFIGSASAKWAVLGPVFVPMMMLNGISPEFAQAAYRVGDSITNIISPLLPYFPIIISFAQRYDKRIGLGTIISCMLPYSMLFGLSWTLFLILWTLFGWELGPGGPLWFDPALIPTAPNQP